MGYTGAVAQEAQPTYERCSCLLGSLTSTGRLRTRSGTAGWLIGTATMMIRLNRAGKWHIKKRTLPFAPSAPLPRLTMCLDPSQRGWARHPSDTAPASDVPEFRVRIHSPMVAPCEVGPVCTRHAPSPSPSSMLAHPAATLPTARLHTAGVSATTLYLHVPSSLTETIRRRAPPHLSCTTAVLRAWGRAGRGPAPVATHARQSSAAMAASLLATPPIDARTPRGGPCGSPPSLSTATPMSRRSSPPPGHGSPPSSKSTSPSRPALRIDHGPSSAAPSPSKSGDTARAPGLESESESELTVFPGSSAGASAPAGPRPSDPNRED